ncbi:MAG TPA: hypothetical protein VEB59_02330, partial [Gemmatimonadales bacterium]|nr:hypothetical protein [Gemmatimonadales bacterium]
SQRVSLGMLDPGSLFPLDPEVAITGLAYDGGVDEESALRRSVGKKLSFRVQLADRVDTVTAVLLGVDPVRFQLPDGRVSYTFPGTALYPAEAVVAEPTATLRLESARATDRLRLGFFTTGATWEAGYQVVLGAKDARVNGAAVLQSQTLRLEDAEVQLLAGAVGRAEPQAPPPQPLVRKQAAEMAFAADGAAAEQRVGEFHVYSLPGRSTLLPGLTTSVALFEPVSTSYQREYVVRGSIPYWGYLPQQGDETEAPVEVTYTLKRARKSAFGDRPLPGGVVRLFQADSGGRQQLVGEAAIDHTPAGEDLRVAAGTAFDLTARRVQTAYTTRRDSSAAGIRTIATADYRVTVRNATDSAVTVFVDEERGGEWSVVSSSVPADKLSSTRTRFRVAVPARGEARVTYRVRIVY